MSRKIEASRHLAKLYIFNSDFVLLTLSPNFALMINEPTLPEHNKHQNPML